MTKQTLNILWLDDMRNPNNYLYTKKSDSNAFLRNKSFYDKIINTYDVNFTWVKNLKEFSNYIIKNGMPDLISFDHDLGKGIEKGLDCAKWLVNYCKTKNIKLPKCYAHSANINGRQEINNLLNNCIMENKNRKIVITEEQQKYLINEITSEEITTEAENVNLSPTENQKAAGNYRMGHISIKGMKISIENPKGSKRYYTENGEQKYNVMKNHYGYFNVSKGKDGDQVDVFIGPHVEDFENVYCVDQNNKEGNFDETKVMLGFKNKEEAKQAYLNNFSPTWKGFRCITGVTLKTFKRWLYRGRKQRQPFAEYVEIKKKQLKEIKEHKSNIITENFSSSQIRNMVKKLLYSHISMDYFAKIMPQKGKILLQNQYVWFDLSEKCSVNTKIMLPSIGNRFINIYGLSLLDVYLEKMYKVSLKLFYNKTDINKIKQLNGKTIISEYINFVKNSSNSDSNPIVYNTINNMDVPGHVHAQPDLFTKLFCPKYNHMMQQTINQNKTTMSNTDEIEDDFENENEIPNGLNKAIMYIKNSDDDFPDISMFGITFMEYLEEWDNWYGLDVNNIEDVKKCYQMYCKDMKELETYYENGELDEEEIESNWSDMCFGNDPE